MTPRSLLHQHLDQECSKFQLKKKNTQEDTILQIHIVDSDQYLGHSLENYPK